MIIAIQRLSFTNVYTLQIIYIINFNSYNQNYIFTSITNHLWVIRFIQGFTYLLWNKALPYFMILLVDLVRLQGSATKFQRSPQWTHIGPWTNHGSIPRQFYRRNQRRKSRRNFSRIFMVMIAILVFIIVIIIYFIIICLTGLYNFYSKLGNEDWGMGKMCGENRLGRIH